MKKPAFAGFFISVILLYSHLGSITTKVSLIGRHFILLQPLFTKLNHFHRGFPLFSFRLFVVALKLPQMTIS